MTDEALNPTPAPYKSTADKATRPVSSGADFNRVGLLLHIVDLSKNWPTLRDLHDEAMRELVALNADCAKEWADKQAKIAAEKARVDAEKAKIAKDKADQEAANQPKPRAIPATDPALAPVGTTNYGIPAATEAERRI